MMQSLLSPNQLCSSILSIIPSEVGKENMTSNVQRINLKTSQNNFNQKTSVKKLREMQQQLRSQQKFQDVLRQYHFEAQFKIPPFQTNCTVKDISTILNSYLMMQVDESLATPRNCIDMLTAFTRLLKLKISANHKKVCISAFYNLCELYQRIELPKEPKQYIHILFDFFSNQTELPSECYSLLSKIAKAILNIG